MTLLCVDLCMCGHVSMTHRYRPAPSSVEVSGAELEVPQWGHSSAPWTGHLFSCPLPSLAFMGI